MKKELLDLVAKLKKYEEPIITNLTDLDLYKITMLQVIWRQHPNAFVKYAFKCRQASLKLGYLAPEIIKQLANLKNLKFTEEEINFLTEKKYLKRDFIEFLKTYSIDPSLVKVEDKNKELVVTIEGKWIDTILFETYILSIVNELYYRGLSSSLKDILEEADIRLTNKMERLHKYPKVKISEFGTRRRFAKYWQEYVLRRMIAEMPTNLVGTSNVYLAMKYGIPCHGTMAHEYLSAHLALVDNLKEAQKRALYSWLQEYDNDLGTALTDTFTTDAFFRDFGHVLSNGFSGLRHDSGDPYVFAKKAIDHYKKMGIDPRTKTLIFSDSLDIPKAIQIWSTFAGDIGLAFGIGTNLSCDMTALIDGLRIVIKLIECNGKPVVKLSDDISKAMGDEEMIEKVKKAYIDEV